MADCTMTLADIRAHRPCEDGWKMLLSSLSGAGTPLDTRVSLGDIARSNGASDAWWCVRCLDWTDIEVRYAVISVLMSAVCRAFVCTTDARVRDCLDALTRWCAGADDVDLRATAQEAWKARVTAITCEARWAAAAAAEAAVAAEAASAWSAPVVAVAAEAATWAAEETEQEETELEDQRADLIATFPPLHPARAVAARS